MAAREAVVDARRDAAMAQARLAEAAVRYADARIAGDAAAGVGSGRRSRAKPGEFAADELALMLRDQPYQVRCLVARARRMAAGLPTVWEAFRRGELDAEQMRVIDRVARRVTETATLAAIDEQAVDAAQARSPKQLQVWLLRLVVQLEPLAFAQRHRRALAERRVTVVQGTDGMGYVTGEVSAADAAAIDALLAATSRSLGAEDPRTDQQRRADLFADLLLGRIAFDQPDREKEEADEADERERRKTTNPTIRTSPRPAVSPPRREAARTSLRRTHLRRRSMAAGWRSKTSIPRPVSCWAPVCSASMRTARPAGNPSTRHRPASRVFRPRLIKRPRTIRIGVVVPLASLLDASDTPGELADRSGFIPGDILKDQISDALGSNGRDQVLFTRLLTDNGGRLLDVTELGRRPSTRLAEAINIRAGSCRFPTCTVPADRCDLDHHQPVTGRRNLRPKYGSVLPPAPPRQNLRLARRTPRRSRRRLDHARRRTLPMHRRTTTHRTSRVADPQ